MIYQDHLILLSFAQRGGGGGGDTGGEGIILGDSPAGHCFLLRNLIAMNFFK